MTFLEEKLVFIANRGENVWSNQKTKLTKWTGPENF